MSEQAFFNRGTSEETAFSAPGAECFVYVYGNLGGGSVEIQVLLPVQGGTKEFQPIKNLTYTETASEIVRLDPGKVYRAVFNACVSANLLIEPVY